ncbi:YfjI family protein [Sabulicella glaciei]|uniref:YfjI family protein n=1 Tax=Sabulicella glaciei TaxID=2984948 RepID=A0ABT3NRE7_9PROT|nr:YfjI family protein [Roseococcus sp. MDT2-1-1]MCW8084726.1 YfjI family protein [Roseococcus sp. MDT2-1-1]
MADGFARETAHAPEKRPLYRTLPPALPYPVGALGPLRDAAEGVRLLTQAPLALCAQSVLGAAALAVQAHHDVILPGGGRKPLTQIFVSIAESGERKSSVDRAALHAVYAVEARWAEAHAQDFADWKADHAAWKKHKEHLETTHKAKRTELAAALRTMGAEPKPPPHPMLLVADPSPEALVMHLADARPWGGVFTAEGGILVGGNAFNDETRMRTGALLNTLWDGEAIRRLRVVTGKAFLPGRRCSAHVMVQPVVADGLLSDDMLDGLGLLARMLLVAPDSTAGTRLFRDCAAEAKALLAPYNARLTELLEREPRVKADADAVLDPLPLECGADAPALWIAFHDYAERAIHEGGEWRAIRAWGAKAAEHAGRLAAVLAAYAGEGHVSGQAMANGVTLAQHYAAEMLRLKGGAAVTPELREAKRLLDWWLARRDPRAHLSEIYQRGPGSVRTASKARAACEVLVEHGWLREMQPGAVLDDAPRKAAWELMP